MCIISTLALNIKFLADKYKRLPRPGANLGCFWFFTYFLSRAAPKTTQLQRHPRSSSLLTELVLCDDGLGRLDGIRLADVVDRDDRESVLAPVFQVAHLERRRRRCAAPRPELRRKLRFNYSSATNS